jgi:hypothetical protein
MMTAAGWLRSQILHFHWSAPQADRLTDATMRFCQLRAPSSRTRRQVQLDDSSRAGLQGNLALHKDSFLYRFDVVHQLLKALVPRQLLRLGSCMERSNPLIVLDPSAVNHLLQPSRFLIAVLETAQWLLYPGARTFTLSLTNFLEFKT